MCIVLLVYESVPRMSLDVSPAIGSENPVSLGVGSEFLYFFLYSQQNQKLWGLVRVLCKFGVWYRSVRGLWGGMRVAVHLYGISWGMGGGADGSHNFSWSPSLHHLQNQVLKDVLMSAILCANAEAWGKNLWYLPFQHWVEVSGGSVPS